jgi:hypothetical protein
MRHHSFLWKNLAKRGTAGPAYDLLKRLLEFLKPDPFWPSHFGPPPKIAPIVMVKVDGK